MITKSKTVPKSKVLEDMIIAYLQEFKERLTGTHPRKAHTVQMYLANARKFLEFTGKIEGLETRDVDRYIAHLRESGLQEVTLRGVMNQIRALNEACQLFEWTYTKYDTPTPPETYEPVVVTLTLEQITQLVRAQDKLSDAERFYLAISTVFACRREAMCQIQKRLYDEEVLTIPGVKKGRTIKHLIPPVLKPIFQNYIAKKHSGQALSEMFHRIAQTAGLEIPKAFKSQGTGWHSIRRCMSTQAQVFLPRCRTPDNQPVDLSFWADYTGWSKNEKGAKFMGTGIAGHYTYFEKLYGDPFWLDRCIFKEHPLLKVWTEELRKRKVRK